MYSTMFMGALTGIIFGTVLYKVAAMRHSRVLGMLTFSDLKIMKFAFTAIAVASFGYGMADLAGVANELNLVPRTMSFTGWGHILGGTIFGVAMGATGFCPGTAACRASTNAGKGKLDGLMAILGLFAGIVAFAFLKQPLIDSGILGSPKPLTLHGTLGLPYAPVAILSGVFFLSLSAVLDRFGPEPTYDSQRTGIIEKLRGEWHWLPAGAIGGATVLWATTQDGYIGYSGSILALYGWVLDAVGSPSTLVPTISEGIVWRAFLIIGVALGALQTHLWSRRQVWPSPEDNSPTTIDGRAALTAFGGGAGLALGAMIGGGCTTGAFIAAFPTLSLGSFLMGGTFFAVALATAAFMRRSGRLSLSFGAAPSPPTSVSSTTLHAG